MVKMAISSLIAHIFRTTFFAIHIPTNATKKSCTTVQQTQLFIGTPAFQNTPSGSEVFGVRAPEIDSLYTSLWGTQDLH